MANIMKILVFLLLFVVLGFFYRISSMDTIIPFGSLFSGGNSFEAFTAKFNTTPGDKATFKTTIPYSKALNEKSTASQKNTILKTNSSNSTGTIASSALNPLDILRGGNSIIFLETTDRMQPPSFVLCAIESAARVYKDRPVIFLMKGLNVTNFEEKARTYFPTLSTFNNVHFFPLIMEDVFKDTPLLSWYKKVNPKQEVHWIHVSADGCRLALIWKHGGIYMDTDIISVQTIPDQNFLAAESSQYSSNGVFGFSSHHYFTWKSMENFVQNYNGKIWGQQGPLLFTRVLKQFCAMPQFKGVEDATCGNFTIYNRQRFYLISDFRPFYQVWKTLPTYNNSYALHLWNYMNRGQIIMVPGSNTLLEHLYKQHCPSTYAALNRKTTVHR